MTDEPLRVLLISDGRPGHFRQSEAVVIALRRSRRVEVERIELARRFRIHKAAVPRLARLLPPKLFLRLVHGIDATSLPRPDLIVSSGGATLGANVALAHVLGAANIFSGSVRGFAHAGFSLILTSYPSAAVAPNVSVGPKPSPFDPDRVPAGRPLRAADDLAGARISILVGGPTPEADFGSADWQALSGLVSALNAGLGATVTVVTSPRTPEAAYAALAGPVEAGQAGLIDFRAQGAGSIDAAFAADIILATSDSMSMMTEAALSRRPAIGLVPAKTQPRRDDEAIAALEAAGLIRLVPVAVGVDAIVEAVLAQSPMTTNHLDDLASRVLAGTGLGASPSQA